jgi:hypothetical protein
MSVVLAGRTFMTVADLIAEAPSHPLLDKLVRFDTSEGPRYEPARLHQDMLVAEVGRRT